MIGGELITCGVTAFNAQDTIARAIQSVLAQDYRPLDIVVVDDASSDGTQDILSRLASGASEVRVFGQATNAGVASSRNRVIKEARGEFIAFFDDDDVSEPERLSRQVARIRECEAIVAEHSPVICHTARQVRFPDGRTKIWRALGQVEQFPLPTGATVASAILGVASLPHAEQAGAAATCSQMARRVVYEGLGGFDDQFRRSEDDDFAIRAALAGACFVGIATPLVVQTLSPTQDKSLPDQRRYAMMLLEKHRAFLEAENNYHLAKRYFEARFNLMEGHYGKLASDIVALVRMRPQLALSRLARAMANIGLHRHMGRFYLQDKGKGE